MRCRSPWRRNADVQKSVSTDKVEARPRRSLDVVAVVLPRMAVLSERGQICPLGLSVYEWPPMLNVNGCKLAYYWAAVMRSRPVAESGVPPVMDWYFWNASTGADSRRQSIVSHFQGITHLRG